MPFLGPHMALQFQAELAGKGFIGTGLPIFSTAYGVGSALSVVGKSFSTSDVGSTSGAGVGVGVGLTGVSSATVKAICIVEALGKGFTPSTQQQDVFEAAGNALVTELALASLTSVHDPVFAGVGTVVPGSIPVNDSEWAGNIVNVGAGLGLAGEKFPDFAEVLAKGCVAGMATATGTVVITGSGGTPSPGTGSGTGVIA